MKRRLFFMNLLLLALLAYTGIRFRQVQNDVREREARVLGQTIAPEKYPPLPPAPPVTPLVGANYLDVAQQMLMSKDRNPNVIIDPEPPKEKPVMPPLPVAHGLMLLGEPGIILSERPGAAQKTYRKGEQIGPFKLLGFDANNVVMDWNGETVERKLEDLLAKGPAPDAAVASGSAPGAAPQPIAPAPAVEPQPLGPGADIGGGIRACQANDSLPSGSVQGGFRKIEVATPFGKSCRWEPAR